MSTPQDPLQGFAFDPKDPPDPIDYQPPPPASVGETALPREIVNAIYKRACACQRTPLEAQKEPCLCPAHGLVDEIEDWATGHTARAVEAATKELGEKFEAQDLEQTESYFAANNELRATITAQAGNHAATLAKIGRVEQLLAAWENARWKRLFTPTLDACCAELKHALRDAEISP